MRLENKVAVVTGAMSGIGKKIGERFLEEGAKVIFSDINEDGSVEEYGENAKYFKCDVSNSKEVDSLIKEAVNLYGRVDIVVNNAGIGDAQGIADVTDDNWSKVIGINLSGVMYGMRAAAREMVSGGSIINMSSILGKVGFPGAISYCAAKGGVVQLTHAGAIDLAKSKIRVNAIAPGFIKTNMTEGLLGMEEFKSMIESSTPLGYVGDPLDIANAAVYLASDESKYVTGEVIYVDGGWTAR